MPESLRGIRASNGVVLETLTKIGRRCGSLEKTGVSETAAWDFFRRPLLSQGKPGLSAEPPPPDAMKLPDREAEHPRFPKEFQRTPLGHPIPKGIFVRVS